MCERRWASWGKPVYYVSPHFPDMIQVGQIRPDAVLNMFFVRCMQCKEQRQLSVVRPVPSNFLNCTAVPGWSCMGPACSLSVASADEMGCTRDVTCQAT